MAGRQAELSTAATDPTGRASHPPEPCVATRSRRGPGRRPSHPPGPSAPKSGRAKAGELFRAPRRVEGNGQCFGPAWSSGLSAVSGGGGRPRWTPGWPGLKTARETPAARGPAQGAAAVLVVERRPGGHPGRVRDVMQGPAPQRLPPGAGPVAARAWARARLRLPLAPGPCLPLRPELKSRPLPVDGQAVHQQPAIMQPVDTLSRSVTDFLRPAGGAGPVGAPLQGSARPPAAATRERRLPRGPEVALV